MAPVNGILTRANPNIRIFDGESLTLSTIRVESADLCSNIQLKNQVCRTRIRISGYSPNPNPCSGVRIFEIPFTGDAGKECQTKNISMIFQFSSKWWHVTLSRYFSGGLWTDIMVVMIMVHYRRDNGDSHLRILLEIFRFELPQRVTSVAIMLVNLWFLYG